MIMNVFSIKPDHVVSPLAKLSILRVLTDRDNAETDTEHKYMTVEDLQKYFLPMGLGHISVLALVSELLEYRLIDPYDPSSSHVDEEQRVRISSSGRTHMDLALHNPIYVSSMACTTGLRDYAVAKEIENWMNVRPLPNFALLMSAFVGYCLHEDETFMEIPPSDDYAGQRLLRSDLKGRWSVHRSTKPH